MENVFSVKRDNHSVLSNHRPPHYPVMLTQASSVVGFVFSNRRLLLIERYCNTAPASQTVGMETFADKLGGQEKLWERDGTLGEVLR